MTDIATRTLTLTPPNQQLFAAVEVHASADGKDWRVVGAWPAFDYDGETMHPLAEVPCPCKLTPQDRHIKVAWVYENSRLGIEWTSSALTTQSRRNWRR